MKKALNISIVREIIEIQSVEAKILEKKVAYLRLKSFNSNSSNQLSKKIIDFEKKNKPVGYILDLRNNPGGLLKQAIDVTNFFLMMAKLFQQKAEEEQKIEDFLQEVVTRSAVSLL